MEDIRERLSLIPDPRHPSYIGYKLSDILIIIMVAVLCGLDQLCDIVLFANERVSFFERYFDIGKIHSKPTFSRVLNYMKADEVSKVIVNIMKDQVKEIGSILAFDGKAIRSTSAKGKPHSALQILTAYMVETGVVLAQESIHEKTNEIPVLRDMLDYIDVKGKIVTADAMHCQRDTCNKIVDPEHGGDYVFGLKENQGSLYEDVDLFFSDPPPDENIEIHTETEKSHGRIEKRICRKTTDIGWLSHHEWDGLKSVFAVRRIITSKSGTTDEMGYYISSLDAPANELLHISHAHWGIESMHWMLDEDFSEDECMLLSENGQKPSMPSVSWLFLSIETL
ncbi:ISAs1 family transposase [Clostridia bacterium]|nr:ISAs1 family transposase [Clostridia bacterium]